MSVLYLSKKYILKFPSIKELNLNFVFRIVLKICDFCKRLLYKSRDGWGLQWTWILFG